MIAVFFFLFGMATVIGTFCPSSAFAPPTPWSERLLGMAAGAVLLCIALHFKGVPLDEASALIAKDKAFLRFFFQEVFG